MAKTGWILSPLKEVSKYLWQLRNLYHNSTISVFQSLSISTYMGTPVTFGSKMYCHTWSLFFCSNLIWWFLWAIKKVLCQQVRANHRFVLLERYVFKNEEQLNLSAEYCGSPTDVELIIDYAFFLSYVWVTSYSNKKYCLNLRLKELNSNRWTLISVFNIYIFFFIPLISSCITSGSQIAQWSLAMG